MDLKQKVFLMKHMCVANSRKTVIFKNNNTWLRGTN